MKQINLLEITDTKLVRKTQELRTICFKGKEYEYPVYQVNLDILYYNADNYHVASDVADYETRNKGISLRELSQDMSQRKVYNDIMDKIFGEKISERDILKHLGEQYVGIVLQDGKILDGNFQFYKLKKENEEQSIKQKPSDVGDGAQSKYFDTIILTFDGENDEKQIKSFELDLVYNHINNMTCERCKEFNCKECEITKSYYELDKCVGFYRDVFMLKHLTIEEYTSIMSRVPNKNLWYIEGLKNKWQLVNEFLEYIGFSGRYKIIKKGGYGYIVDRSNYFLRHISSLDQEEHEKCRRFMIINAFLNAKEEDYTRQKNFEMLFQYDAYKCVEEELVDIDKQLEIILSGENINSGEDLELIYPKCMALKEMLNSCVRLGLERKYDYREEYIEKLYKRQEISECSISNLDISERSQNILMRNGIDTIAKLMTVTEDELSNIRTMGRKSIQEILAIKESF